MKLKNNFEEQYINLLKEVMTDGKDHTDRTGVGRRSIYGANLALDLSSFPILQTKHVSFHNIKHELLWFLGNHLQSPLYNSLDIHILILNI
jgi:thymidylate synthase